MHLKEKILRCLLTIILCVVWILSPQVTEWAKIICGILIIYSSATILDVLYFSRELDQSIKDVIHDKE